MQKFCLGCNQETTQELLYYKVRIPIYQCTSCGLGAAEPEQFDSEKYYDASYFDGGRDDGYSDYAGAKNVLHQQFSKELGALKMLGPANGNLLELGCAYGFFLDMAKESYHVHGLEICEAAVQDCNARGLTEVRHGAVSTEAVAPMPMMDVVVMLDVIEHLPNPDEAIALASSKMKPGALLVMTTGDFSSFCAKIMRKHWRLMTPPPHLWFFTPRSLNQIAARHGLELVHLDHPSKKVPIGLIIYQLGYYLSIRPKLPSWMHRVGVPVNLFDAMRIAFRKPLGVES